MLGSAAGQNEAAVLVVPRKETRDKVLGLIPVHGDPGLHCSAAGMGVSAGAEVWERCLATGAEVSEMGSEDGTLGAHRGRALEAAAGCRGGSLVEGLGDDSSHPDVQKRDRGGGRGWDHGGGACGGGGGGGGCCFHGNDGDCCGCDGGVESDDPCDCADAS